MEAHDVFGPVHFDHVSGWVADLAERPFSCITWMLLRRVVVPGILPKILDHVHFTHCSAKRHQRFIPQRRTGRSNWS